MGLEYWLWCGGRICLGCGFFTPAAVGVSVYMFLCHELLQQQLQVQQLCCWSELWCRHGIRMVRVDRSFLVDSGLPVGLLVLRDVHLPLHCLSLPLVIVSCSKRQQPCGALCGCLLKCQSLSCAPFSFLPLYFISQQHACERNIGWVTCCCRDISPTPPCYKHVYVYVGPVIL